MRSTLKNNFARVITVLAICLSLLVIGILLGRFRAWGIPSGHTENRIAFNISFWSALYAGLISGIVYSLLTGLIVGFVLWQFQAKAERRRELFEMMLAFSTFRQQLRATLDYNAPPVITSVIDMAPRAKAVADLLKTVPLHVWERNLTDERPLLTLLHEFQNAYSEYTVEARKLQDRITQLIRTRYWEQQIASINDQYAISYIIGRLHGFEASAVIKWVLSGPAADVQQAIGLHEGNLAYVHGDAEFAQDFERYREVATCMDGVTAKLIEAVRS